MDSATVQDREMEEAHALLRDAELVRTRPPSRKKDAAARALLEQLLSLDGVRGLKVWVDDGWNELGVQLGQQYLTVRYVQERGVGVLGAGGIETNPELDFDPVLDRFVGRDIDRYRAPIPGEAPQRRPAIAVLVEHILERFDAAKRA